MSKLCVICLKTPENLITVTETDSTNYKILLKLRKCVPEVEWNNNLDLCISCVDELNKLHAFKELCIQSFQALQKPLGENSSCTDDDHNIDEVKQEDDAEEKSVFICYHCNESFVVKSVLAAHIHRKHGSKKRDRRKKLFGCDKCQKMYTTDSARKKHAVVCVVKVEDDNGIGENCKENVVEDEIESCEEKPLITPTCSICGTCFSNKYLLKRHLRNVHATEKKHKCDMCERTFASPVYLNAHKKYHSGDRSHICSFCGKGFITTSDLYHHEKIHANKRAYRCETCPKAFNTSSDLHKHKICVHQDRTKWKYECSYCQRRFPLKTNLDTHTKTHTGEKNFACHLCDRRCINRSVLMRHIETHSNVISFKCHLCLQGYKYQKSLDVHLAKMHGLGTAKVPERVKKYFCHVCPKAYFANNKLQKHIRSHTGERPFQCPACDKAFIDKSYVKQHLRTAHAGEDTGGYRA